MNTRHLAVGIALGMLGIASQACTLGSDTYITTSTEKSKKDGGADDESSAAAKSASAATGSCGTDDFAKPDLQKLTACGGGKGHCFDKTKTPNAQNFGACPDDASMVCVPDEILKAGGDELKTCTSILGKSACVNVDLVPQFKEDPRAAQALNKDVCDAGQICVPCINPLEGNAPTGFCGPVGVHENACTGGAEADTGAPGTDPAAALPTCCVSGGKPKGVCLNESGIPEDMRDQVKADTCSGGNKCVPQAMVSNKPVKCTAGLLGDGVCMDKCFNDMMSMAGDFGFLGKANCDVNEVCVPCMFAGDITPGCQ